MAIGLYGISSSYYVSHRTQLLSNKFEYENALKKENLITNKAKIWKENSFFNNRIGNCRANEEKTE